MDPFPRRGMKRRRGTRCGWIVKVPPPDLTGFQGLVCGLGFSLLCLVFRDGYGWPDEGTMSLMPDGSLREVSSVYFSSSDAHWRKEACFLLRSGGQCRSQRCEFFFHHAMSSMTDLDDRLDVKREHACRLVLYSSCLWWALD